MVDYEDIAWAPTFYGVAHYENKDVLSEAKESSEKFLEEFLNHPLAGQRLDYFVSDSIDVVSDVIVDTVKKGEYGLVVMKSQAGPITARILGSSTKAVIREAGTPVVVYPYHFKN